MAVVARKTPRKTSATTTPETEATKGQDKTMKAHKHQGNLDYNY
jgi:hypothetical protein